MTRAPVLTDIVRQHAEMAAFLWTVYDRHLLYPEENPELDEIRISRLLERLEAHLDGLRVAGAQGHAIAKARYDEFPEPGELFVLRMLEPSAASRRILDLDIAQVRRYIAANLPRSSM